MSFFDLVKVSVAGAPGTGPITMGSAVTGFLDFADVGVPDGALVSYGVLDGTKHEVGHGNYDFSGNILTRNLEASSTGDLLDLTSGAIVFITILASDMAGPDQISIAAPIVSPYYTRLGLTQVAAIDQNMISASVTEDLGLTQIAAVDHNTISAVATEDFGLTQTATVDHNTISAVATGDFGLTQTATVDHNTMNAAATEDLGLTQTATVTGFNMPSITLLLNTALASGTTVTVSVGASVPAGALIFAFGTVASSANPITSAGDSQNGASSYTLVTDVSTFARLFYFVNSKALSASDTFTFAQATASAKDIIVGYVTNIGTGAIDINTTANVSSTNPHLTTATPSVPGANEILLAAAWFGTSASTITTESTGWTTLATNNSGVSGQAMTISYFVNAAGTAQTYSATVSTSALWGLLVVSFKPTIFT